MKNQHDDLLDVPTAIPQRFPVWAAVGAVGIMGMLVCTVLYIKFTGLYRSTIRIGDLIVPQWMQPAIRISQFSILFGVVLTLLRKEPKSTFRSWVIGIGALLLLLILALTGFMYYVDAYWR